MITENIDIRKTISRSDKQMELCKTPASKTLYKVIVFDKTTKHILLFGKLSVGFSKN